ncbi:DUF58 domain-containing protein [Marinomonas dokdonensis]|uniref:DUF58 domain-containing protein n=1 Tax=Marinomonas dokdonensis TaxID=328224 RepID=UPI00405548A7
MSDLLSPSSPELDESHFTKLAHYAKQLGRAPQARRLSMKTGEHRSRQKGHGMEMLELRPYQASDDLRHIDWRVTARTGQAHTRLYAQENDHQRMLLMDLSNNAYFATRHTFISTRLNQLAGLIAWRSMQQGDKLGYRLSYGQQDFYGQAKQGIATLIQQLVDACQVHHRLSPKESTGIWQHPMITGKIHNQDIIILTDHQDIPLASEVALQSLAKHNHVHWVQIIDSQMFNLPSGHYQFADPQGTQSVQVNRSSQQKAKQNYFSHNAKVRQKLARMGVHYQLFDITESPENIARSLLKQGALR